jgi:hypothetical protein
MTYFQTTCYRTLFEKRPIDENCHARPPAGGLSGIYLIEIEEFPAKNMRPKGVPVVRE